MAEKRKPRRIVIELRALRETTVRYARANLTVARSGAVAQTPVAEVLKDWRTNERTDADVAWSFVKQRITRATPSFDWDTADLDRLIGIVVTTSIEPNLTATNAAELAVELDRVDRSEQERWLQANEQMRKNLRMFSVDLPKTLFPPISNPLLEQMNKSQDILRQIYPVRPDLSKMVGLSPGFEISKAMRLGSSGGLNKTIQSMSLVGLSSGFDISKAMGLGSSTELSKTIQSMSLAATKVPQMTVIDSMKGLTERPDFKTSIGIEPQRFQSLMGASNWDGVVSQFAEAARAAQEPRLAEVVEATAELAVDPAPDSLDDVMARLQPHIDRLERAIRETKDSQAKMMLATFAVGLMLLLVQVILARLGISLQAPPSGP